MQTGCVVETTLNNATAIVFAVASTIYLMFHFVFFVPLLFHATAFFI